MGGVLDCLAVRGVGEVFEGTTFLARCRLRSITTAMAIAAATTHAAPTPTPAHASTDKFKAPGLAELEALSSGLNAVEIVVVKVNGTPKLVVVVCVSAEMVELLLGDTDVLVPVVTDDAIVVSTLCTVVVVDFVALEVGLAPSLLLVEVSAADTTDVCRPEVDVDCGIDVDCASEI